ncbi:MAG TPA: glycosyltransferase family 4 protein [Azospirillaceae bacterium]|nr:glycosyltransferase family 4 protein [Azospirillaceae bacterium]
MEPRPGIGGEEERAGPLPSRILMTTDCVGGIWDYALTLAGELGRRGMEVELAVIGKPAGDQIAHASTIPGLTLHARDYRLEWMPEAAADVFLSGQWLMELEHELKPDLVHVNGYAHAALPFRVPVLAVGHSCVRSWFADVKGGDAPEEYDTYGEAAARGLASADMVVTPTFAMMAALERHYGPVRRGRVVPNGRDPDAFTPGAKEDLVLSAGRAWDEAKNILTLDAVAPSLCWPVAVAGEWRHPGGAERRPGNVACLGRVPASEMWGWYAKAGIFCLPARYEPFGLAILEAALSGCALVLGDIPSLRELWKGAACFVRPDDRDGLKRSLNALIADPARRADMGAQARIRAKRYSAAAMAEGYLAAYAELLAEPRRQILAA